MINYSWNVVSPIARIDNIAANFCGMDISVFYGWQWHAFCLIYNVIIENEPRKHKNVGFISIEMPNISWWTLFNQFGLGRLNAFYSPVKTWAGNLTTE